MLLVLTVVCLRVFSCQILSFCDSEIISNLMYEMRSKGARFLLGETIKSVEVTLFASVTSRLHRIARLTWLDVTFIHIRKPTRASRCTSTAAR